MIRMVYSALVVLVLGSACASAGASRPATGVGSVISEAEFINRLVDSSPWKGEFGSRLTSGTLTASFTRNGGSVAGQLLSISAGTACPGPFGSLEVKGDKLSFRTPCNNVYVELKLEGDKLDGSWSGTSSGWISLSPSTEAKK